jgi:hypothetical protein
VKIWLAIATESYNWICEFDEKKQESEIVANHQSFLARTRTTDLNFSIIIKKESQYFYYGTSLD